MPKLPRYMSVSSTTKDLSRTALSYESAYATRLPLRAFPLVPFVGVIEPR
jgi:hypothetical protein|nr:hypothetical protein Q903MT_gene4818 [Picea sitchensis]